MGGFNELNNHEQLLLNELIEKETSTRVVKEPTKICRTKAVVTQVPRIVHTTGVIASSNATLKALFTNADQLTPSKKTELILRIDQEKPLIIGICEVKPKNSKERELLDYNIPGFTLHSVNLEPESNKGRGLAVYTPNSIAKSVIQIQTDLDYQEACLLEARLHGGDLLLFGCF